MLKQFDNRINDEFSPDTDYLSLIRNIMNNLKEPSGVNNVIEAFQNLHRLLHTEEKLFIHVFNNVYDGFKKFLLNENHEIVKECLTLLSELFRKSWLIEETKDWVVYLIPSILCLSNLNDGSLDDYNYFLLTKCLQNIPRFFLHEETALTLLHAMTNENSDYTERASNLFKDFLRCSDQTFIIDAFEWNEIFENIFWLYVNGNKKRNIAVDIIVFLHTEIFSAQEWEDVMSKLDDEYLEKLIQIVKFNYTSVYEKKKKFQSKYI